jgi:putative transposase
MNVPSTNNRTQSASKRGGRKWMPGGKAPMAASQDANVRWSLDLIGLPFHGQRFRVLAVADDFTRECLRLVVDTSFTALRVTRELGDIIEIRGRPRMLVSDYSSEFTSIEMLTWHEEFGIELCHIIPGSLSQRRWAETLNRRLSNQYIMKHLPVDLNEARQIIDEWRAEYNRALTRA